MTVIDIMLLFSLDFLKESGIMIVPVFPYSDILRSAFTSH